MGPGEYFASTRLFPCVPGLRLMRILNIRVIEFTRRFKFVKEKKTYNTAFVLNGPIL